jgi:hypothetical protein
MGLLRCARNDQTRLAVFTNDMNMGFAYKCDVSASWRMRVPYGDLKSKTHEKGLSLKNNPLHSQQYRLAEIVVVVEEYKSLADFF